MMRVGVVSDGKFGDRTFDIIKERFPTEWIIVPFPPAAVVDDIRIDVRVCPLYISYARHTDVAMALADQKRPIIFGISSGPGFIRQVKQIDEDVIAPITMCSLDNNTWNDQINEFAAVFGLPTFEVEMDGDVITSIKVTRGSQCGSTGATTPEFIGREVSKEMLQQFGLRICHHCRAPRFGRTCDKEFAGLLHIRQLIQAIRFSSPRAYEKIQSFSEEIDRMYEEQKNTLSGAGKV
jgi:hypothetical protein